MHELAIAQSIADVATTRATEVGAARVSRVRVRIGDAAGVVTDSLAFCFEMLASTEPLLLGAELEVERAPHRARCRTCGSEFAVRDFVVVCPACDGTDAEVISGTELTVLEMEIEAGDGSPREPE
jgi:hydrogenase nickel incorporation protein HypA/HybF